MTDPTAAPFIGYPTLIEPSGPRSPTSVFSFAFAKQSDPPWQYDLQIGTDPELSSPLYDNPHLTAGINGRKVNAPYSGPALPWGTYLWWRARGRLATGEIGAWPRARRFTVDAAAVTNPYATWARTVLAGLAWPRPLTLMGTAFPEGGEVLDLLGLPYLGRLQVYQTQYPPVTNKTVEVLGWSMNLTYADGWSLELVTHDVV